MPEPIPLHEALARHEGFVRSLARRLARDADEADDVTQETWLRVLERAPDGPAGLADRLARTVRTVAGSRRRAERRRGERERRVAAGERETDPARIEEALERQRAVVDEVLALDEALRHVVLLRHREGHGVAEVARLLAVPVETVRTRQKRAYALLRRRL